jgi:glycosyltransferase involved in cell wall biosynthesis
MAKSRPRRVALFTGNYVSLVDGVALTLNRLVEYMESRGDEVVVFAPAPRGKPALEPKGRFVPVPSVPFWAQPEYSMAMGVGFGRELRAFKPDLVHLATPDVLGHSALYWALANGVTPVASFHSNLVSYFRFITRIRPTENMGWWWLRNFYDRCAHTYVPTTSMAEELRRHGFRGQLRIWDRGVETERFSPDRRSLEFRRSHGVEDDEPLVVFVARLRWEKGLRLLADVFEKLHRSGHRFRTMIVGDGVGGPFLRERLPDTIFTGEVRGEALATAYASGDVFFYPSETDTFGNVTLEAMASGLPTVCAAAPGSLDLVVDGRTGLLVPPGDVDGFVHALERLVVDHDLRTSMSHAALARSRRYTWEAALGRLMDHYDELIPR